MQKIIFIILSCFLLSACELEMSDNGKLDGNWQLRQTDTVSTGGICDMSRSYIYWAFENDLLLVRDIDNGNLKILFRFEKKGNELYIHSPHFVVTKDELTALENDSLLSPLGIADIEDHFFFEELSNGSLVIKNESYRLHFRKY